MPERVAAIEAALIDRNIIKVSDIDERVHQSKEDWVPENGARIVARAWSDPAFKRRLLDNGKAAVSEMGLTLPAHHKHLVVLENTAKLQNVICCSLCSCTAFTLIGLPPGWYKDFEYRSRVVRQSRTVLQEMGLTLPEEIEIKVWDTTTDTRYMVLPVQPPETIGWSADKLAEIVTKESMIGVARLESSFH